MCVGPSPGSDKLVRATGRIADSLHAPWHAVHVDVSGAPPLSSADRDRVEAHLSLAEALGAQVTRLTGPSVAAAVLVHVREHNVTQLVAGKPTHSRSLSAIAGLQPLAEHEMAVARWAGHEHRRPAGRGTDTLPSARLLAMPPCFGAESAGVVVVEIALTLMRPRRPATTP